MVFGCLGATCGAVIASEKEFKMPTEKDGTWSASTGLARGILHDRGERRKWLAWMILLPLLMIAAGLWVIEAWLWQNPWRALCWWGACAVATLVVILFATYDALAAVSEERKKHQGNVKNR